MKFKPVSPFRNTLCSSLRLRLAHAVRQICSSCRLRRWWSQPWFRLCRRPIWIWVSTTEEKLIGQWFQFLFLCFFLFIDKHGPFFLIACRFWFPTLLRAITIWRNVNKDKLHNKPIVILLLTIEINELTRSSFLPTLPCMWFTMSASNTNKYGRSARSARKIWRCSSAMRTMLRWSFSFAIGTNATIVRMRLK